jgi:putative SOS response-associated peptidase YedK
MCNLYRMTKGVAEVANLFRVEPSIGANFAAEVFPGYPGLVIAEGRARVMTWGFPQVMRGKKGQLLKPRPVTNARDDNLSSPFWRASFEDRRCLIPATAWAEPQGEPGKMTCTWHSLPRCELFAIAGLWRPTAEWGNSYTMVMVDSCSQMAEVHDRMPVILKPHQWEQWTGATPGEAFGLVRTWCDDLNVERTERRWGR